MPSCIGIWRRSKRDTKPLNLPTLVELTQTPQLSAAGELNEEKATRVPSSESTSEVDLRLPIELWRSVFEYARAEHRHTLAQLLRLHPALLSTAEDVLYHTITLRTDTSVVMLSKSISCSLGRAKLIRELHVLTRIATTYAALSLACLLRITPELDYLTLGIAGVWRPYRSWDMAPCVDILAVRFPHLRGFATSGPPLPSTERGIPHFVRRHSAILQELNLRNARAPDMKRSAEPYDRIFLPELRVLACHPRMIWEQLRVTERLRSVCLTEVRPDYLLHLSGVVGSHLVSLCLRSPVCQWADDPQEMGWTIATLVERFPRLKHLQIDRQMGAGSSVGVSNYPIDWQAEPPESPGKTAGRLTVVWVHKSREPLDVSTGWWTSLMDESASRALVNWSAYLERILYRYADGPFVSVSCDNKGQVAHAELVYGGGFLEDGDLI
ncbi:hypothetical protein L226DRAFT_616212 [Lentinus tigrinus ALCF2SS1-7]|uniref:F-box domain-containing protein n=1 Tax=Lentinus tigrinus ALCF2SS1-6 TaxID=1328759 RepID=A0A5C2RV00_9APHY|nr:hypothetical protein L227DRAFT_657141 [Lentinus tigrinus ALCF2SS1-6]RPD70325.1 hypothetical protein L226DRAFT_616212 [Lentinus tigrinus ALCF2SS1-7]